MQICGFDVRVYFLLFMIYAMAGWLMEVICKLIQYKRFINRGFLIGPYCPIYGYGALYGNNNLRCSRISYKLLYGKNI